MMGPSVAVNQVFSQLFQAKTANTSLPFEHIGPRSNTEFTKLMRLKGKKVMKTTGSRLQDTMCACVSVCVGNRVVRMTF